MKGKRGVLSKHTHRIRVVTKTRYSLGCSGHVCLPPLTLPSTQASISGHWYLRHAVTGASRVGLVQERRLDLPAHALAEAVVGDLKWKEQGQMGSFSGTRTPDNPKALRGLLAASFCSREATCVLPLQGAGLLKNKDQLKQGGFRICLRFLS